MNFKHGFYSRNTDLNPDSSYSSGFTQKRLEMQYKLERILKAWFEPNFSKKISVEEMEWANQILKDRPEWAKDAIEKFDKATKRREKIPLVIFINKP